MAMAINLDCYEELGYLRKEVWSLREENKELKREMSQLRKVNSEVAMLAKLDMKNDILKPSPLKTSRESTKVPSWVVTHEEYEELTESQGKCRECGGELVERTNKNTGDSFLGCSNFPKCKYTEELDSGDRWDDEEDDAWHPGHPSNYGDR